MLYALIKAVARLPGARTLWHRFPMGSVPLRTAFGIWPRPAYAYGVYKAAVLARKLGLAGVTAVEFGVAGGNGLIALERQAGEIGEALGIEIDVVGFDGGSGMPQPTDHRDLPFVWGPGFYQMDEQKLRARLQKARLVIGPVEETVPQAEFRYPVGFVSFDLDYYSSTLAAFRLFDLAPETRTPRVICYFDDVIYPEHGFLCEHVGELAAIETFNQSPRRRRIGKIAYLNLTRPVQNTWCEQMYVLHDFDHPRYAENLAAEDESSRQIRLP